VLGRALKKLTKPSGDVKVRFFTVCPTNDVMSLDPYWTINFTICKLLFSYIFTASNQSQDDHSLDNVKFPDNSLAVCRTPAHVNCHSYHARTSVIVTGRGRNATVHDQKPN